MSEIASKPYTEAGSSLAPPFAKKGAATEHDVMFAALFGGVVATQSDGEPLAAELNPAHADADAHTNPDGNADILMAMQAVAAMLSGHPAKRQNSDINAADGEAGDALPDALTDPHGIASVSDQLDQEQLVNPAMIGPMPLQQPNGKFSDSVQPSGVHGKMAFEDEAPARPSRAVQTAASAATQNPLPAGKTPLDSEATDEMPRGQLDSANSQQGTTRRAPAGPKVAPSYAQQAKAAMLKPTTGPDGAMAEMSGDGDMQFDSPDEFIRALAGQTAERSAGRQLADAASGDTTPTNAARLALAVGSAAGGQMSQQNNGQSGGQSGSFVAASAGMTNGSMMDMLDMAQDNWTEMLLQRVEKGLAGGKDKIDFHLNPRNLGKMRISLMVQNDCTNIHIQTETHAAAQALSEAEVRLAQMMDASGVKFGSLTSQYNQNFAGQNFGGQNDGQDGRSGRANSAADGSLDENDANNAEISVEPSENLINMQA
ncbi:flagellar hook-length control protein FliK [Alphaproteobacteria bacterium]|nr:flagellar hook-length control protein FliK [Alphaproteobacteria bacterium]MDC1120324.1 flagellar hook-length control protein FliK [Alphaproteobacteria bacterium]